MAAVSSELPIDGVFEFAGPLVTARCTSVCRTWRAAAEKLHVWRMHVENMCGRTVANALEDLQREDRTSLTFKELSIKRWRSTNNVAASGYTWTQVVPYWVRNDPREQLAERFRLVLLEASLVYRQTGARMAFVTVPMDDTHIRRLFTKSNSGSGVPSATTGVPFPKSAWSKVENINDCSIVFTVYDLSEAHAAKIMTAHFAEPASSDVADNGVENLVSCDMETEMGEIPWQRGLVPVAADGMPPVAAVRRLVVPFDWFLDAMTGKNLLFPTTSGPTLRLHPVLVVAENPPLIRLRLQFMYWEDEGDGVVQEFNTEQVRKLLDRLLVQQAVWV